MKPPVEMILNDLLARIDALAVCRADLVAAFDLLADCFSCGGRLYIAGNGGSAADAEHIAGEFLKAFAIERKSYCPPSSADDQGSACEHSKAFVIARRPYCPPNAAGVSCDADRAALAAASPLLAEKLQDGLPAIPLTGFIAARSAFANDVDPALEYAQLVWTLGRPGDVFWGLSTSGNAANVLHAAAAARARGMKVLALTGSDGGRLAAAADVAVRAPQGPTFLVQELHLPIYHGLCLMLEAHFYGEDADGSES